MTFCPGLLIVRAFEVQKPLITKVSSLPSVSKTYLKPQRPETDFLGICTMFQQLYPRACLQEVSFEGGRNTKQIHLFFRDKIRALQYATAQ